MATKKEIISKVKTQVKTIEHSMKHRALYNARNIVLKSFVKTAIILDYITPFLLSGFVLINTNKFEENPPYKIDKIPVYASIKMVDTSNGVHVESFSYDYEYDTEKIEYTTGWKINEEGFYERIITTYRINKKIDLNDIDSILLMSKDEIENMLSITNVKKITKDSLSSDDHIYDEEGLIITRSMEKTEQTNFREETRNENLWNSLLFVLYALGFGFMLTTIKNVCFRNCISKKLQAYEVKLVTISEGDLREMEKILYSRKKNLELILDKEEEPNFQYRLRKDIWGK